MKTFRLAVLAVFLSLPAHADTAPETGKAAPAFTTTDAAGKSVSLADYKGKIVVLEWTNKDCPFVHKEYDSGAMQALQQQATSEGVVWLTVEGSAPGHEGYVDGPTALKVMADWNAHSTSILLDPTGTMGHMYAAKTTPHMYVIDKEGLLAYEGAIDDKPSADKGDIEGAHNYVRAALSEIEQGKPVTDPATRAYGCAVKYGE